MKIVTVPMKLPSMRPLRVRFDRFARTTYMVQLLPGSMSYEDRSTRSGRPSKIACRETLPDAWEDTDAHPMLPDADLSILTLRDAVQIYDRGNPGAWIRGQPVEVGTDDR